MRNFSYIKVSDPAEASALLDGSNGTIIAGGTDLLPLMKDDVTTFEMLVDISRWREGREIRASEEGVQIGALATLSDIASDPLIVTEYAALSEACNLSAAPQLRNMGTIGGNLLQATRCWYFRGPYNCWLKGGDHCYARDGENELHSIFHTSPKESICVSASPSDPATALLALNASVSYRTTSGTFELPLDSFFRLPTVDNRNSVSLPTNAIITSINLPSFSGKSLYRTVMSRATWTFALAGVALATVMESGVIKEARVSLGGVAPIPIRMKSVEEAMVGEKLSALPIAELSQALVATARPLSQNGYKSTLLAGLFREALSGLQ